MNRRTFLNNSMLSTAALASHKTNILNTSKTNLDVVVMGTNWGFAGNMDELCKKLKAEGYEGVELWWPTKKEDQKVMFEALQKYELHIGFLVAGTDSNFSVHEKQFNENLKAAAGNTIQKPLYINCHSGKDFFTFDQNSKIIESTIEQEAKTGIEVLHETHRGRMCFAAHITKGFLEKYDKMKLTLDISHWTNVHESMLENQTENVEKALMKVGHIHARIGHEEGPQVNDPRAPEWKYVLDKHLSWWDKAVANREKTNAKRITFLTEFGPPNYLPTLPYTQQPIANQWEINVHMMKLIKDRYKL
jgi:sugar phosphate isomerase/epimerase